MTASLIDLICQCAKDILRYEPETGKLYWLERPAEMFRHDAKVGQAGAAKRWNARFAGKEAFRTVDAAGYLVGSIFDLKLQAHRVAWLLCSGGWPVGEIDHINGDRADNRIANLRPATRTENATNRFMSSNNTSGACGVFWHKRQKKWTASIGISGRHIHLGSFDVFDDAVAARVTASHEHGFSTRHGTPWHRNPTARRK